MPSSAKHDGVLDRLIEFLETVPLTPWWWFARRRNGQRKGLVRHVRQYY